VKQLSLPVILVVGVKLGCLNHALLTQEAMLADGVHIAGWVANMLDPQMSVPAENLASLKALMTSQCLGVIPHLSSKDLAEAATYLYPSLLEIQDSVGI
jgi:dethiobiotin synthetase